MEITSFQNYSDALIPLPALPLENGAGQASPVRTADPTFQDELQSRIDNANQPATQASRVITPPLPQSQYQLPVQAQNPLTPHSQESDEIMQVCRDIEGFLLSMLLKNMGKAFSGSTLFAQTRESSFYKDMFFNELAQSIGSQPPGFGIAEMLYSDIIMRTGDGIDETV